MREHKDWCKTNFAGYSPISDCDCWDSPECTKGPEGPEEHVETNPKAAFGALKAPMTACPTTALIELYAVMGGGAHKYGIYNFRDSKIDAMTYIGAIRRHFLLWEDGVDTDEESGRSHLAHIMACCALALDAQHTGKLVDNRSKSGLVAGLLSSCAETHNEFMENNLSLEERTEVKENPYLPSKYKGTLEALESASLLADGLDEFVLESSAVTPEPPVFDRHARVQELQREVEALKADEVEDDILEMNRNATLRAPKEIRDDMVRAVKTLDPRHSLGIREGHTKSSGYTTEYRLKGKLLRQENHQGTLSEPLLEVVTPIRCGYGKWWINIPGWGYSQVDEGDRMEITHKEWGR